MDQASDIATAILLKVGTNPPPPPGSTIADILALSKSAHLNYRQAQSVENNPPAASAALIIAARLRADAELADPDHLNPAWRFDASTHPGGEITQGEINLDLLQFYLQELSKP